jgi:hypothetical protein
MANGKHKSPAYKKNRATTALTPLVRLLSIQAAREALAPSTHASISDDDGKSADTNSSSTASITVTSLDGNPAEVG